jgi:hypothetical protein
MGIVCSASIVADGGVFSPSIALGGGLDVGRKPGVELRRSREDGVGVAARDAVLSGEEKMSLSVSRPVMGVTVPDRPRSGERSGARSGDRDPSR